VLSELLKQPRALLLSILFHAVIIGVMVVNLSFIDKPTQIRAGQLAKTVQAEMIDSKVLEDREKQKQREAERKAAEKKKKQLEAKKRADKKKRDAEAKRNKDEKKKAELKRKKQAEEKRKKEAAEKKRKADEKSKADAKRKTEEKRKADAKRKSEEKRKADEKRKAEEARIAEEKRKAEEARLAEEERKRVEAEQRRLAEEEQKRKEEELRARMLAEENQRRLNTLREAYKLAIRQKVERNWKRPAGSEKMPVCEVLIEQGPGGIILKVDFGSCDGSTDTYRASIENAVLKAEPLPKPGDPELFERELKFLFKPIQ